MLPSCNGKISVQIGLRQLVQTHDVARWPVLGKAVGYNTI